jgi:chaperone required for assembly of F1-ATPase
LRDILYPPVEPSDPNPMRRAQNAMARVTLPKRFYKAVEVFEKEGIHAVTLDGRTALTPGRKPLALPTHAAAELIATEWRNQGDVIDPAVMHATRMANTGIDSIGARLADVQADAAAYAGSDLVCYRAGEPDGLVARQREAWDPVVGWAADRIGVRIVLVEGVMHQAQTPETLAAVRERVSSINDPIGLAALHVMTTMTGSCLIALMAADGSLSSAEAWSAATVDDVWQAEQWGFDEEAQRRMERRRDEFAAAVALHRAIAAG